MSRSAAAMVEIVAIGDTKPQFTQSIYNVTIEEETVPETVVLKVSFSENCHRLSPEYYR